jgi:transcription elongation GreA/GreB family factor
MTLKQKIHQHYLQQVQDNIDAIRDMIVALTEESRNDAKSSAGDKHETALSMMHIEQERLNRKISEYLEQKAILEKIDSTILSKKVILGSLVKANKMLFFISTALPKINIDQNIIFAVSPQSPLGSQLMGKEVGFEFVINGIKYLIEAID